MNKRIFARKMVKVVPYSIQSLRLELVLISRQSAVLQSCTMTQTDTHSHLESTELWRYINLSISPQKMFFPSVHC